MQFITSFQVVIDWTISSIHLVWVEHCTHGHMGKWKHYDCQGSCWSSTISLLESWFVFVCVGGGWVCVCVGVTSWFFSWRFFFFLFWQHNFCLRRKYLRVFFFSFTAQFCSCFNTCPKEKPQPFKWAFHPTPGAFFTKQTNKQTNKKRKGKLKKKIDIIV